MPAWFWELFAGCWFWLAALLWTDSSGRLLVDSSGRPIDCPTCPCSSSGGPTSECCPGFVFSTTLTWTITAIGGDSAACGFAVGQTLTLTFDPAFYWWSFIGDGPACITSIFLDCDPPGPHGAAPEWILRMVGIEFTTNDYADYPPQCDPLMLVFQVSWTSGGGPTLNCCGEFGVARSGTLEITVTA